MNNNLKRKAALFATAGAAVVALNVAPATTAQAVTYTGPDRVCVSYNSSLTGPAYITISIFNPLRILWPYYTKKIYRGECSTKYTNALNRMYGFRIPKDYVAWDQYKTRWNAGWFPVALLNTFDKDGYNSGNYGSQTILNVIYIRPESGSW